MWELICPFYLSKINFVVEKKNVLNKTVWVAIPAEELVRPLLPRLGPASMPPAAVISLKLDKLLTLKLLKMKKKYQILENYQALLW